MSVSFKFRSMKIWRCASSYPKQHIRSFKSIVQHVSELCVIQTFRNGRTDVQTYGHTDSVVYRGIHYLSFYYSKA